MERCTNCLMQFYINKIKFYTDNVKIISVYG